MKLILALGAVVLALATAAPALAGQSADQSAGTAQIGTATVDPSLTANAPVNADAPVCVASDCSDATATQTSGGSEASTSSGGGGDGGQTADQSAGTVQVTDVNGSPAVTANAPVNADAPVCVASDCSGATAAQTSGGSDSSTSSGGGGAGGQTADQSAGTVQVTDANGSPAVTANAPVNADAP